MAGVFSWVQSNWSNAISAVGIIGSLCFTAGYFREDTKTRQVSNVLAVSERHRILWSDASTRPELSRIFNTDVDLAARPILVAEEEFLNLAFVHFEMGWRLAKSIGTSEINGQQADIRHFFSLPLPHVVWEKTKSNRNPKFVRFVERALRRR
jgi:hypothetical protein